MEFGRIDSILAKQRINVYETIYSRNDTVYKSFWGLEDSELFNEATNYLQKQKTDQPRLDIYLTLSSHSPFKFKQQEHYVAELKKRVNMLKLSTDVKKYVEHNTDIFSTLMYVDQSIRMLFEQYRKIQGFENTIFIITGDHHTHPLPIENRLELYHVPLIIYSPLLKGNKCFESVVSHLDITPSILNLLFDKYHMDVPEYAHWIGYPLDTAAHFQSKHNLLMMTNSREVTDYVSGIYFNDSENTYYINPNIKSLQRCEDQKTTEIILENKNLMHAIQKYVSLKDMILKSK